MAVTREEWDNVIQQTEMQIDKMTVSLELQRNALKFAKLRIEQYPQAKPIVEPIEPAKSDKDVGIIKK